MRSNLAGLLFAVGFVFCLLFSQSVFAAESFIGDISVVASAKPSKDSPCPQTIDYDAKIEILKKPFYGVYNWEVSFDGGKTWDTLFSYNKFIVDADYGESYMLFGANVPIPAGDRKDGKKHVYAARFVYAYGAARAVSKTSVFSCGP